MTDAAVTPTRWIRSAVGSRRLRAWVARVFARVHEGPFWGIQVSVIAVTALHIAVEASGVYEDHAGPLAAVMHIPIMLYVLPVVYAGLRYGYEGGLLTGVSIAVLATPNLIVWHGADYEWMGEALLLTFVVAIGVVIALPVEREQRQRARAELARQRATAVSRRLALLNEIISTLAATADVDEALRLVLHRAIDVIDLETAAVITWRVGAVPSVAACHSLDPAEPARLRALLDERARFGVIDALGGRLAAGRRDGLTPFEIGEGHEGALLVRACDRTLDGDDVELIDAIGHQIGVALARLEMHRAEQRAVRTYLQGVTRAQEDERRRIARQLHDIATHELLLLSRDLERLATTTDSDRSPQGALADPLRARVGEVIACLRRFGRELRPSILEHLGLAPALEWLASQANDRGDVTCRSIARGAPRRLDSETELALYRIAEEALRNAERHADATIVELVAHFTPGQTSVTVLDDGRGFHVPPRLDTAATTGGLGLTGMQERATLVDADLDVTSTPGTGTRVTVTVPVTERPTAATAGRR